MSDQELRALRHAPIEDVAYRLRSRAYSERIRLAQILFRGEVARYLFCEIRGKHHWHSTIMSDRGGSCFKGRQEYCETCGASRSRLFSEKDPYRAPENDRRYEYSLGDMEDYE